MDSVVSVNTQLENYSKRIQFVMEGLLQIAEFNDIPAIEGCIDILSTIVSDIEEMSGAPISNCEDKPQLQLPAITFPKVVDPSVMTDRTNHRLLALLCQHGNVDTLSKMDVDTFYNKDKMSILRYAVNNDVFSSKDIGQIINCSVSKAVKLLNELICSKFIVRKNIQGKAVYMVNNDKVTDPKIKMVIDKTQDTLTTKEGG